MSRRRRGEPARRAKVPQGPPDRGPAAPSPPEGRSPPKGPSPPATAGKRPGFFGTLLAARKAVEPIGRRRVLLAFLTVGGIGVAGLVLLAGFSFWWTSRPSFCARCHVMEKYVDAWEASPHKNVNCESCHVPPGTFGYVGGKIAGLQVVLNYARGRYDDTSFNAAVGNASCLECHKEVLAKNVHKGDVVVSHAKIVETGGKCVFCHSTVAHGSAVPIGSHTEPSMATCLKCHNDKTAPLRCNLCHTARSEAAAAPTTRPPPATVP